MMSGRNEYRREEKAGVKQGKKEIVMCPASEVYISTAPQKQNPETRIQVQVVIY